MKRQRRLAGLALLVGVISTSPARADALRLPEPVAARYAWADDPVCNLVNERELPASPFRTDGWLHGARHRTNRGGRSNE